MEQIIFFTDQPVDKRVSKSQGTCPTKYRRVNNNFRGFLFILLLDSVRNFTLRFQSYCTNGHFIFLLVFLFLSPLIRRRSKLLHVKMRDDVKSCVTHNAFLTSAVIQSIHRVLWTTDEYTRNFTFHTSVHYEMEIEGVC